MSGESDRHGCYKRRRINTLDYDTGAGPSTAVDDVQLSPPPPSTVQPHNASSLTPKIINLVPHETLTRQKGVPPLKVYVGSGVYLEIKEFRKSLYIGLSKEDAEAVRNRFNIPLSILEKVEEGLQLLKQHVLNHGEQ